MGNQPSASGIRGFLALGSHGGGGRRGEARVSSWTSGPNVLCYCASAGLSCGLEREAGPGLLRGFGPTLGTGSPLPALAVWGPEWFAPEGRTEAYPFLQPCRPPWDLPFLDPWSVDNWECGKSRPGSARGPPLLLRGHGIRGIPCVRTVCPPTVCRPLPAAPDSGPHSRARESSPLSQALTRGGEVRQRTESGVLLPWGWESTASHS